jgi:hypothetical protein
MGFSPSSTPVYLFTQPGINGQVGSALARRTLLKLVIKPNIKTRRNTTNPRVCFFIGILYSALDGRENRFSPLIYLV